MKKWFVFHVIFKILLTVFNQSYNCQTSHYLGRNLLPKPLLSLPSLLLTIGKNMRCRGQWGEIVRTYYIGFYGCPYGVRYWKF